MIKRELQQKINELKKTRPQELNTLISYMLQRGYSLKQWKDINNTKQEVVTVLEEYFNNQELGVAVGLSENLNQGNEKINLNELKELSAVAKKNSKKVTVKEEQSNNIEKENNENMEVKEVKSEVIETAVTNDSQEVTPENNSAIVSEEVSATDATPVVEGSNALQINNEVIKPTTNNAESNEVKPSAESSKTDIKKPAPSDATPSVTPNDVTPSVTPTDTTITTPTTTSTTTPKVTKPRASKNNTTITASQIKRFYKTIDNISYLMEKKVVTLKDVTKISDDKYVAYINGRELAKMWMKNELLFNPTMQRGVKTNAEGKEQATFSDYHVREIEESMLKGEFEPTQIHFAILVDDPDTKIKYDEESQTFTVDGKINLLDGQHRVRSLVKITNLMGVEKDYPEVNLEAYVFNVEIHYVTSDRARAIYAMLDKNLRLDKSQVKQLSTDDYALIGNYMNQDKNSPLKGKIATCKPVGKGLVLFSTFCNAIQKQVKVNTQGDREEVQKYLTDFFNYLVKKLPTAFGSDIPDRLKFKETNLMNENNFFWALLAVAYEDTKNYKKNIDKLVANVDFFKKNNKVWLDGQAVKVKKADKDKPDNEKGYAMSNSETAFDTLIEETLKLIRTK